MSDRRISSSPAPDSEEEEFRVWIHELTGKPANEFHQSLEGLTAKEAMVMLGTYWDKVEESRWKWHEASEEMHAVSAERVKLLQDAYAHVSAENNALKTKLRTAEMENQDLRAFMQEVSTQLISRVREMKPAEEDKVDELASESGSVTEPDD